MRPYHYLSDEEITRQLKENLCPILFTELINRYQLMIVQSCTRRLKSAEAAQDVSQEVLLRVLTKISSYRGEAPFSAWLQTIIHNRCTDHIHQNKKQLHEELSKEIIQSLEEETTDDESSIPTIEMLEELMEQLSGEDKLLLLLRYKEKWPVKTIETALQIPEGRVKMRLSRAKEKIRKFYQAGCS